jgi:hypothetical protein
MDGPGDDSTEEDYNSDNAAADAIDDDSTDDEDYAGYELDITDQVLIESGTSAYYIFEFELLADVFSDPDNALGKFIQSLTLVPIWSIIDMFLDGIAAACTPVPAQNPSSLSLSVNTTLNTLRNKPISREAASRIFHLGERANSGSDKSLTK